MAVVAASATGLVGCADTVSPSVSTLAPTPTSACVATDLRVAVAGSNPDSPNGSNVIIADADGVVEPVTTDNKSFSPAFTPDGGAVTFQKSRDPLDDMGGSGVEVWLANDGQPGAPMSYSQNFGPEQTSEGAAGRVIVQSVEPPQFSPTPRPVPPTLPQSDIITSTNEVPLPASKPIPLWLVDSNAQTVTAVLPVLTRDGMQGNPAWNPAGGIAFVETRGAFGDGPHGITVRVVRPDNTHVDVPLPADVATVQTLAWSADGARVNLAVGFANDHPRVTGHVDVATRQWSTDREIDADYDDLAFAADGRLVGARGDRGLGAYVVQVVDGGPVIRIPLSSVWSIAVAPCVSGR